MDRYKNVFFWLGVISIIYNASGVDYHEWTTWNALFVALENIINNPATLITMVLALISAYINPNTKGLKD